jgi:hypothetical protein
MDDDMELLRKEIHSMLTRVDSKLFRGYNVRFEGLYLLVSLQQLMASTHKPSLQWFVHVGERGSGTYTSVKINLIYCCAGPVRMRSAFTCCQLSSMILPESFIHTAEEWLSFPSCKALQKSLNAHDFCISLLFFGGEFIVHRH